MGSDLDVPGSGAEESGGVFASGAEGGERGAAKASTTAARDAAVAIEIWWIVRKPHIVLDAE